MPRTFLPSAPRYSLSAYLPGQTQSFVNDGVVNARLARVAPSTFRRRAALGVA